MSSEIEFNLGELIRSGSEGLEGLLKPSKLGGRYEGIGRPRDVLLWRSLAIFLAGYKLCLRNTKLVSLENDGAPTCGILGVTFELWDLAEDLETVVRWSLCISANLLPDFYKIVPVSILCLSLLSKNAVIYILNLHPSHLALYWPNRGLKQITFASLVLCVKTELGQKCSPIPKLYFPPQH